MYCVSSISINFLSQCSHQLFIRQVDHHLHARQPVSQARHHLFYQRSHIHRRCMNRHFPRVQARRRQQPRRQLAQQARLLTTASLDAGEVAIHATPVNVGSLMGGGEPERPAGDITSWVIDLRMKSWCCIATKLMEMLLTQYIDNACKYCRDAKYNCTEVVFSVHSFGTAIPMADQKESYRASSTGRRGRASAWPSARRLW